MTEWNKIDLPRKFKYTSKENVSSKRIEDDVNHVEQYSFTDIFEKEFCFFVDKEKIKIKRNSVPVQNNLMTWLFLLENANDFILSCEIVDVFTLL